MVLISLCFAKYLTSFVKFFFLRFSYPLQGLGDEKLLFRFQGTRAMKLKNQISNDISDTKKFTLDSPNSCTQENRTMPFSVEQLIQAQHNDSYAKNILDNIKNYKNYIIKDNLLMYRSNPPVPYVPQGDLRRTILQICHDTAANGAHFEQNKTIHKIKKPYFWPSMYKDINNYIKSCLPYAQFNPRRQKNSWYININKTS